jgi:hypothetical protein
MMPALTPPKPKPFAGRMIADPAMRGRVHRAYYWGGAAILAWPVSLELLIRFEPFVALADTTGGPSCNLDRPCDCRSAGADRVDLSCPLLSFPPPWGARTRRVQGAGL